MLSVQAQLAAAAAARGAHPARSQPPAPAAPSLARLPPPDLSLRLRLNVGGQRFEVSQHVLLQDPTSLLAALCAVHNEATGTPMPTLDDVSGEDGAGLCPAAMGSPHMLAITAALAATSLRPRIPAPSPDGSYFFERDWFAAARSSCGRPLTRAFTGSCSGTCSTFCATAEFRRAHPSCATCACCCRVERRGRRPESSPSATTSLLAAAGTRKPYFSTCTPCSRRWRRSAWHAAKRVPAVAGC